MEGVQGLVKSQSLSFDQIFLKNIYIYNIEWIY
jgi:hypothetical protein